MQPPAPVIGKAESESTTFYTGLPSTTVLPFAPGAPENIAAPARAETQAAAPLNPDDAPTAKIKKPRPDIKIGLQSTVTGAISPFAKIPLPFIKGAPEAPSPEAPPPPTPAEIAAAAPPLPPSAIESPAALPPLQPPKESDKPRDLRGTVTAAVSPFANTPLPFVKAPPGQSPSPPAQPAASPAPLKPASENLNATTIGSVSPFASALPFGAGSVNRAPSTEPSSPPAVQTAKPSLDRTSDQVVISPFHAKALPFQKQPQAGQSPPLPASPSAPREAAQSAPPPSRPPASLPPASGPPVSRPPASGPPASRPAEGPRGTWQNPPAVEPIPPSTPPSSRTAPVSNRQAPFQASAPPHAPAAPQGPASLRGLSMEQYASLCAELSTYPAQTEQVFQRYRLVTAQDRAAVDAEWKARLARDPAEYKRWHDLYWHYCNYLKQRR